MLATHSRAVGFGGRWLIGGLCLAALALPGAARADAQTWPARETAERARERLDLEHWDRRGHFPESRVPLERAIDPATHRLAPGDELALALWGAIDLLQALTVSADGRLLVPTIGEFTTGGKTLATVAAELRTAAREVYPRTEISLTLLRPGQIRVPVTGQVRAPGIYALPTTYRLGDLLALAGGLLSSADTRAIRITRASQDPERIDFLAWRTTGEARGNPPLTPGDRVHVPAAAASYRVRGFFPETDDGHPTGYVTLDRPFVTATRVVPARAGDRLDFVLRAVGWPAADHCLGPVRIITPDAERDTIAWAEAGSYALAPGAIVELPFCRDWVAVQGAVVRPGLYPFLPGQSVAGYVDLAGGPSAIGRDGGWRIYAADGRALDLTAKQTMPAGGRIEVPQGRWHKLSTVLAPLGTAVAVVVSLAAILSTN